MWGGSCLYIDNVIKVGRWNWTFIALRWKWGCSIGQEASSWGGRCRFGALCSWRWTCHVNEMPLIFSRRASQNKYWRQEVWQIYSSACVRGCLATTMKQWNILPRPARSCNFLSASKGWGQSLYVKQAPDHIEQRWSMIGIKFMIENLQIYAKRSKGRIS